MKTIVCLELACLPVGQQRELWNLLKETDETNFYAQANKVLAANPHGKEKAQQLLNDCQNKEIECISIFDAHYPDILRQTHQPPWILYGKGNPYCLAAQTPHVAIVGARNANRFGIETAKAFAEALGRHGIPVISGLALGIDGAAHRGCLSANNAPTIAVLAHGLDSIYPRTHTPLAQDILSQNGILLSQFPPGSKPLPHQFLVRNAIIAGLAQLTIVIQAGKRSGSLATARLALEAGRDVAAIPGSLDDPRHAGTNTLIRSGAYLLRGIEDLAELIPAMDADLSQPQSQPSLTEPQQALLKHFESEQTMHLSTLQQHARNDDIHTTLLELEMLGLLRHCGGNCYARK